MVCIVIFACQLIFAQRFIEWANMRRWDWQVTSVCVAIDGIYIYCLYWCVWTWLWVPLALLLFVDAMGAMYNFLHFGKEDI